MIFKRIRPFSHNNSPLKENLDTGRLSSRIDAMIRCIQARMNLVKGLSEYQAQFENNEDSQEDDITKKKSEAT